MQKKLKHTIRSSTVKLLNNLSPTQKTIKITGSHTFPKRWDKCLNLHKSSCTHFSNVTKMQIKTTHCNENLLTESPTPKGRGWIWVEQQITLVNNFQLPSNMVELGCFLFNKSGVLTTKMMKHTIILREYHLPLY
jgi:hypothetical protein